MHTYTIIRSYDIALNKWVVGYWRNTTFNILNVIDN